VRVSRPAADGDWSHDTLRILGASEEHCLELVPGQGWQPIPPERFTDEYKAQGTRRLYNELGERLGVGPYPRLTALRGARRMGSRPESLPEPP